uniref:Fatty-acid--CoA ligase n=1 Tax=Thermorudis peleae TaxID=1382356 RepID=A0A831TDZ3_9BACT
MVSPTLTVNAMLRRAMRLFPTREILERVDDGSVREARYQDISRRAIRLADGLRRIGLQPGDRVATLLWNRAAHLEAYLAIPAAGGIIHTLNLRLNPQDLAYIVNHAEDRFLLLDASLLPVFEAFRDSVQLERVFVVGEPSAGAGLERYEDLLASGNPDEVVPEIDPETPAFLCYTSGTTGRPKGALWTHAQLAIAALALTSSITFSISRDDSVLMTVPMFHVVGWALPYAALLVGSRIVFPGPRPHAQDILDLLSGQQATFAAGVPTVWHDIANLMESNPGRWQLSPRLRVVLGGSAAPEALLRRLEKLGMTAIHGWGMTEVLLGLQAHVKLDQFPTEERYSWLAKQGIPAPFVEARVVGEDGREVACDGKTPGELQVRGPWVATSYYRNESPEAFDGGWLRTGDIAVVDGEGYIKIVDRAKDLIKSGGEWISTIELEGALMGHPAVEDAAVIGVRHERWQERPLAVVVLRAGQQATAEELRAYLAERFVRWWLPDAFVFVDALPKTSTGKLAKAELRERFKNWEWEGDA